MVQNAFSAVTVRPKMGGRLGVGGIKHVGVPFSTDVMVKMDSFPGTALRLQKPPQWNLDVTNTLTTDWLFLFLYSCYFRSALKNFISWCLLMVKFLQNVDVLRSPFSTLYSAVKMLKFTEIKKYNRTYKSSNLSPYQNKCLHLRFILFCLKLSEYLTIEQRNKLWVKHIQVFADIK